MASAAAGSAAGLIQIWRIGVAGWIRQWSGSLRRLKRCVGN